MIVQASGNRVELLAGVSERLLLLLLKESRLLARCDLCGAQLGVLLNAAAVCTIEKSTLNLVWTTKIKLWIRSSHHFETLDGSLGLTAHLKPLR